ncbi:hypothetical protein EUX98_g5576 [Antrodiella citrinella]|uniref:Uncharacterized protein n=1 Tax=Antrodiella citrinella TaxID=2447956 RepID=A0A4S4MS24_9APHY|nr:hypothetical protein EUX98_g5576 [Antrodiella citrinella]
MALSSQSSDDEAPEAVTFNTLKKTVKGEEAAVQKHRAAEKQKRKEKNRIRDAALKERAAKTKGDAKKDVQSEEEKDGAGPSELELRMARAMKEAAAESGEEDDDEEMEGDEESEQPSDEDDSEEEDSDEGMATQENPDYLPDHLFESAFSQNPPVASSSKKLLSSSKRKATEEQSLKRRKRSRKSNKDIVVGYVLYFHLDELCHSD